ncbi:hypothetical protein CRM22_000938 [Opisthorchis felineus]|uniref:Uncharacterized protein n=1 Tax=Opisthorchis felineus TaxID=147828 RepID=A0A4S2MCU3_OPIFE|nr:hypothetical protein CRM22_000938 [Opisthorchis felineus]
MSCTNIFQNIYNMVHSEVYSRCMVLDQLEHGNSTLLSRINRFEAFLDALDYDHIQGSQAIVNRSQLYFKPTTKTASMSATAFPSNSTHNKNRQVVDGSNMSITEPIVPSMKLFSPKELFEIPPNKLDRRGGIRTSRIHQHRSLDRPPESMVSIQDGLCDSVHVGMDDFYSGSNSSVNIHIQLKRDNCGSSTQRSDVGVSFSNLTPRRFTTEQSTEKRTWKPREEIDRDQGKHSANSFGSWDTPTQTSTPKAFKVGTAVDAQQVHEMNESLDVDSPNSEDFSPEFPGRPVSGHQTFDRPVSPIDCRSPSSTPRQELARSVMESSFETIYDLFKVKSKNENTNVHPHPSILDVQGSGSTQFL